MTEMCPRSRFETLVRPELDGLFRTARRLVGDASLAEEIVQEACLRAFRAFDPFIGAASFRPWLFRIVINVARDELRRQHRQSRVFSGGVADRGDHVAEDVATSGHPDRTGQSRAVSRAFATLNGDLRAVALLVLVEELTYREAAEALSITEDRVRSRLGRARAELRRMLSGESGASPALPEAPEVIPLRRTQS